MDASLPFLAALALGLLTDLIASIVGRIGGKVRPWWRPVKRFGADVRFLVRDRARASLPEAMGLAVAAFGATLAAAIALGFTAGSAALLYLALGAAVTGSHLAASTPLTEAGRERSRRGRMIGFAAEPAFLVALTVPFLRWRAGDLEAIRGAHEVLGRGFEVGAAPLVAGLLLGVVALLTAAALRAPQDPGIELGAGGGPSLAVAVSSWFLLGSTALVAGAVLAARAGSPGLPQLADPILLSAVAGGVVVLGLVRGLVLLAPGRLQAWGAGIAAVLALVAAGLVVL